MFTAGALPAVLTLVVVLLVLLVIVGVVIIVFFVLVLGVLEVVSVGRVSFNEARLCFTCAGAPRPAQR